MCIYNKSIIQYLNKNEPKKFVCIFRFNFSNQSKYYEKITNEKSKKCIDGEYLCTYQNLI